MAAERATTVMTSHGPFVWPRNADQNQLGTSAIVVPSAARICSRTSSVSPPFAARKRDQSPDDRRSAGSGSTDQPLAARHVAALWTRCVARSAQRRMTTCSPARKRSIVPGKSAANAAPRPASHPRIRQAGTRARRTGGGAPPYNRAALAGTLSAPRQERQPRRDTSFPPPLKKISQRRDVQDRRQKQHAANDRMSASRRSHQPPSTFPNIRKQVRPKF